MVRPILECRPKDIRPTCEPTQKEAQIKGAYQERCAISKPRPKPINLETAKAGSRNHPQPILKQF
jgi:hypothetical protein